MKTFNNGVWLSPLLMLMLFTAIIVGCISKAETPNHNEPASAPAIAGLPVDAVIVQPVALKNDLEITGELVANQQVSLMSELTRRVVNVNVKEGAIVSKGTLLFQLDDADLQAQRTRFQYQLKLAELNEARLKDLIAHDAVSQQDYDEASTQLNVLKAQITEVEVMIGKAQIRAPFNGKVGMIDVHPGAIVSTNAVLTTIVDHQPLKVEFAVPEKYINVIRPGSDQTFTTTASHKVHHATVVASEASVSGETHTLLVRAVTLNTDGDLLPGQSVRLSLALQSAKEAIAISSQALMPSAGGYSVYVWHHATVTAVPVTIGQRNQQTVEITDGIHKGDTVITSNLLRLMPGAAVTIVTLN